MASMTPATLNLIIAARSVYAPAGAAEIPTTESSSAAEGVASNSMWNVLVCGTASAMFVQLEAFELTQPGVTGGVTGAALTVNVAALLVALPAALCTVTANVESVSP